MKWPKCVRLSATSQYHHRLIPINVSSVVVCLVARVLCRCTIGTCKSYVFDIITTTVQYAYRRASIQVSYLFACFYHKRQFEDTYGRSSNQNACAFSTTSCFPTPTVTIFGCALRERDFTAASIIHYLQCRLHHPLQQVLACLWNNNAHNVENVHRII